jgi:phosphoribosylformimino-5-aminoimidazole carboxamide ribotide isomerase
LARLPSGRRTVIVWVAVDILRGRAVRLAEGRRDALTDYGPAEDAFGRWAGQGLTRFHVVDLGAAFGEPPALEGIIGRVVKRFAFAEIQAAGGIRSADRARRLLDAGAARIVAGSLLYADPESASGLVRAWGPDACVAALDAREGRVRTGGWLEDAGEDLRRALARASGLGFREALVTDIARDGKLAGPNLRMYEEIGDCGMSIIASGGVSRATDLGDLSEISCISGAVVGKALYEGRITPRDLGEL